MRRTTPGITTALALALAPAGPTLAAEMEDGDASHPPHIHVGLCPAPGDVVAVLSDVAAPMGNAAGPGSAIAVEVGPSDEDLALPDRAADEHSIVVHWNAEDMAPYVACGDIGGTLIGGTGLAVGLAGVADPRLSRRGLARRQRRPRARGSCHVRSTPSCPA